jgi:hypothetical protein
MRYKWIAVAVMTATWASTVLVSAQASEEQEEPADSILAPAAPTGEETADESMGGLGTEAAEKERMHRSRGEVGKSVAVTPADEERQLQFHFHGYYRTRYNWIGNAPITDINSTEAFRSKNASYGYMRLRLDPEVTYGPDPKKPVARL